MNGDHYNLVIIVLEIRHGHTFKYWTLYYADFLFSLVKADFSVCHESISAKAAVNVN